MLSSSDMKLAQHLNHHKAVIMKSGGDAYPAYPFGDRRKRSVCWVSQDSFKALSSFGGIEKSSFGYGLVKSFARRCEAGGDFAGQHRTIKERDVYLESGAKRKARINRALSALAGYINAEIKAARRYCLMLSMKRAATLRKIMHLPIMIISKRKIMSQPVLMGRETLTAIPIILTAGLTRGRVLKRQMPLSGQACKKLRLPSAV